MLYEVITQKKAYPHGESDWIDDKNRFVISLTERGSKNAYSLERLSQQSLSNIYNTDSADTAGLGLYIANGFVTKMNGQLYINSLRNNFV